MATNCFNFFRLEEKLKLSTFRKSGSLRRLIGLVVALAATGFLVFTFVRNWNSLPPIEWDAKSIGIILLVVVINCLPQAIASETWRLIINALGHSIGFLEAYAISGRSQIAKYLPGNVFHYVGKAEFARQSGIAVKDSVLSMALETGLVLLACGLVATPSLFYVKETSLLSQYMGSRFLILVAFFGIVVALVTAFVYRSKLIIHVRHAFLALQPKVLLASTLLYGVTFLILGLSMRLLAEVLWPGGSNITIWQFTTASALAWGVGFVTPGAPGGIGVREMVLFLVLGASADPGLAAGLFLSLRLANIIGDLFTYLAATIAARRCSSSSSSSAPSKIEHV